MAIGIAAADLFAPLLKMTQPITVNLSATAYEKLVKRANVYTDAGGKPLTVERLIDQWATGLVEE